MENEGKVKEIIKQFQGELKILGESELNKESNIDVIPTGSYFLDSALQIGGWPRGRMTEIWGTDQSGKTTLAIHAGIEALKKYPNQFIAFLDVEHALDARYAKNL